MTMNKLDFKFDYYWPEVLTTGVLNVEDTLENRASACSKGLTGWGNCHAGAPIPENFGKGMAAIGKLLNITPTPENLHEYAAKIIAELDARKEKP